MELFQQLKNTPRWQGRRELVRQATKRDAAALLAWLPHEREGWVRAALATRFGELTGPEAHQALEQLKSDDSGLVRIAAVKALDAIQNLEARFQIREVYEREDDPLVRQAVVESQVAVGEIAALGKLHATLARQSDPSQRALAIYGAMLEVGREILPTLRDLWRTETSREPSRMILDLLARLGEEPDERLLIAALDSEPAPQDRIALVVALKRRGGQRVRAAFIAHLAKEADDSVCLTIVHSLGTWEGVKSQAALRTWVAYFAHAQYPNTYHALRQQLTPEPRVGEAEAPPHSREP